MAVVTAAARVLGSSRGLGQDGLLLLRRLGVRGLAISVSTWGTWSFPQGGMGCHRCLESVGYVQGVKAGLSQKGQGLGKPLGEDTPGKNFHFFWRGKTGSSFVGPEGGRQLGGREEVSSLVARPSPGEAAWRDLGGRRDLSAQGLESERGRRFAR